MTRLLGVRRALALPVVVLAIGALGCGSETAISDDVDGGPERVGDGASAPIGDGTVATVGDDGPERTSDGGAMGDAEAGLVGDDASVEAGMPGPPCAASPEIHGNLKPAWSMALGTGQMGGIATDSAGNILVGFSTMGAVQIGSKTIAAPDAGGYYGPLVAKVNPSGGLLWSRSFVGQGNLDALAIDAAGDVYIAGDFNGGALSQPTLDLGTGVLQGTLFLAKLDPSGATLWSQAFQPFRNGNSSISAVLSLAVDPAGDVAVMGLGLLPAAFGGPAVDAGSDRGFLAAFDPAGHYQYSKVFNGEAQGAGAQFDPSGNLFITGSFEGSLDLGTPLASTGGGTSAFAAKLTPTGQVQWQLVDGTYSAGSAVAASAAGAFVAGTFSGSIGVASGASARGTDDVFFAALDENAAPTFETAVPGASESIVGLAADPSGGVVAIGQIENVIDFGGGPLTPPGIVLAKLDSTGKHVFSARLGLAPYTGLIGARLGEAVALDPTGDVIAAGEFYGAIDLGTGVLAATGGGSFPPAIFLAKYTQESSTAQVPRAACPLPPNVGVPDAGRLVTAGEGNPTDIALGADSVYWSTGSEVMSAPVSGGDPVVLAYAQKDTVALATDSRSLYWVNQGTTSAGFYAGPGDDGTIMAIGLDGGAPTVLAGSQDAPQAIAVDDVSVYWTAGGSRGADGGQSPGAVLSVPIAGGSPTVLVTGLGAPGPVAVSGGVVVFASSTTGGAAIASVPRTGGTATPLATSDHNVVSIAVDATKVYWVDGSSVGVDTSSDDGRIRSAPLAGGAPVVLADNQAGPGKMVLLGGALFWSNRGSASNARPAGDAAIWSLPSSGGVPTALVSNRPSLGAFAIDATHLAWIDGVDTFDGVAAIFVKSR